VNDIIIKVVAAALRNVPEANGKQFPIIFLSICVVFTLIILGVRSSDGPRRCGATDINL